MKTPAVDNLSFVPCPIEAPNLRPAGVNIQVAQPIIQRQTAIRAYNAFTSGRDWMEKLSHAYVVALATRSADTCLMKQIQSTVQEDPVLTCARCRESTIGVNVIREKHFPVLHQLREHANDLLHHLENPENRGIATLNVQGVFEYCYHLFEVQAPLLFGEFPQVRFEARRCKEHRNSQTV